MELSTLEKANAILAQQADIKLVISIIDANRQNKKPFQLSVNENSPTLNICPDGKINFIFGECDTAVELPAKTKGLIDDFSSNLKFALEMKLSDLQTEFDNL